MSSIDAKGRISMPSEFRNPIESFSGDVRKFCLNLDDNAPYISCATLDWREATRVKIELEEEAARQAGREYDLDKRERDAFGSMIDLPFDTSGRFILPTFFREEAKLEDLVFFYGRGSTFELWNPRVFIETPGLKERDKRAAQSFMAQRGVA